MKDFTLNKLNKKMKRTHLIICLIFLASCGQINTSSKQESLDVEIVDASSTKLNLADTTINFLWRAMKLDTVSNDSFNSIFLNKAYLKTMTKPEKAAIGYVSTFIGNECWWDGPVNDDRDNLDCKIITALGLGYQCSENHLSFLRKWFSTDKKVLSELEKSNCPTTPYTATRQSTFNKIVVSTKGDSISVHYEASYYNISAQESLKWSETMYFNATAENLNLISRAKSEGKQEKLKISAE